MSVLSWIIAGLIAGWLARLIMKGGDYDFIGYLAVGILGALLGGILATRLFVSNYVTDFNLSTMLIALIGSIALLWLMRLLPDRSFL